MMDNRAKIITDAVVGLTWLQWREIRRAIDRKFDDQHNRLKMTRTDADDALRIIENEGMRDFAPCVGTTEQLRML